MKNYSLRSSTVKKTEATNERLRIKREIKKSKRTSNLLRKLCSREEIYLFDSALELTNLPAENYETVELFKHKSKLILLVEVIVIYLGTIPET